MGPSILLDNTELLADHKQTCHLVLRETAFVHKEYKYYIQLIPRSMQAESNNLCPEARLPAVKYFAPTPRCDFQVIE